ncbi:MAG: cation-translocating P-type ATPase, partial [Pseudomonadales bacterium]|nr:cation-translocating P-type ATPase [Pseudomonadales bacterium]
FEEEKRETILQKILYHLRDLTSLILLAAAGISFYLAIYEGENDFAKPVVILSIVIINTFLAVHQEIGAQKAIDALKSMHAHKTTVLRGGDKKIVDATQVVVGDILTLEAGDMVPADARLIISSSLRVDESLLTGESVPAEKDATATVPEKATLGDQTNMIFSGCLITGGTAKAVVVAIGMQTEMGKIAGLLNSTKKTRTPLQKRMANFAKMLTVIALVSGAILFGIKFLYEVPVLEMLLNAVALAVAAVPETLPVIVTMTLALGVQNMAKKNAIIRKIPAVETLGSASVICSDKTGTLTMNKMTIAQIWATDNESMPATAEFGKSEMHVLELFSLASNATLETGDPTEIAIIQLLHDKGITKGSLDKLFPKVHEIPFDSERKLMTTVHELEDGRYLSVTKGAFDRIPTNCRGNNEKAQEVHDQFADNALRVLAVAYKHYDQLPENLEVEELENGLTFAGVVGMIDPPRPESARAVAVAHAAGIKTVMITGDHVATATAIAKEIGIMSEDDRAISGVELEAMSQEELIACVKKTTVYARVSPEDKIRIVQAWQTYGDVVAMTGDGVNDAPALKAANVGIAMGSGTDVSKNASDVILSDDNYASIVDAVEEGRKVYDNIKKAIYFLLSCNISEIAAILVAVIVGWGMPVTAVQILFINVVADGVPGLFISREPVEDDAMNNPPVNSRASILAGGTGIKIAIMATVFAVTSLIGFYIGRFVQVSYYIEPSHEVAQTMAFMIIGWSSVVNILNVRSNNKSIFTRGFFKNKTLLLCACFSLFGMWALATVPFLMNIFDTVPVSSNHWLIMIGLSIVPIFVGEIQKVFLRSRQAKKTV